MLLTPSLPLFYIAFAYAFCFFCFSILIYAFLKETIKYDKKSLVAVFLIALVVRIIPTLLFPFACGHDMGWFLWAGQKIIDHKDIYDSIDVRSYFSFMPTYAMYAAGSISLAKSIHTSPIIFMKLLAVFFDCGIAVILSGYTKSLKNGIVYGLCPIPLVVSAYLGQFDAIPLFFVLISLILFSREKIFMSLLSLGAAAIVKPWPFIFLPLLIFKKFGWKSTGKKLVGFLIAPVIIEFFYMKMVPHVDSLMMIKIILSYDSSLGWWGPSILFSHIAEFYHRRRFILIPTLISKSLSIGIILFLSNFFKKFDIFVLVKAIILVLYIFSFGLGIHYFLWIFPFALITKDIYTKFYMMLTGLYLLCYGVFHLLDYAFKVPELPGELFIPLTVFLWLFFVQWGRKEYRVAFGHKKRLL